MACEGYWRPGRKVCLVVVVLDTSYAGRDGCRRMNVQPPRPRKSVLLPTFQQCLSPTYLCVIWFKVGFGYLVVTLLCPTTVRMCGMLATTTICCLSILRMRISWAVVNVGFGSTAIVSIVAHSGRGINLSVRIGGYPPFS